MSKNITPINDLVEDFLKKHGPKQIALQSRLLEHWDKILSKQAVEQALPVVIKNKVLVIVVSNSAMLHQLAAQKTEIIKRITWCLGNSDEIIDLRFKIGTI